MKKPLLSVSLTEGETVGGWIYFAAELLVIPTVLQLLWTFLFPEATAACFNFLYYSMNFAAIITIFHGFLKKSAAILKSHPFRTLLFVLLGLLLERLCGILSGELLRRLEPAYFNINDSSIAQISRGGFALMASGMILLVPTAEECLFRGLLFRGLYDRSRLAAYLVSALCFCAIHVMGYWKEYEVRILFMSFLQYLPSGLCLAWAYEKSDTIITPILIHTLVNAIGVCALR